MPKISINEKMLNYEIHGTKGPWVLLIMGFATQGDAWKFQIPALKDKYRVITYDHYGVGKSEKINQYVSFFQMCEDLKFLLDTMNIKRINIIGISMGGMIGLKFSSLYPKLVESLVLMATTVGGNKGRLEMLKSSIPLSGCFLGTPRSQFKSLIKSLFPKSFYQNKSKEWFLNKLRLDEKRTFSILSIFFQTIASFNHNVEKDIRRIWGIPVLIISPEKNIIINSKESLRIKKLIKGSKLIRFVDGGHGIHLQYTEELNFIILKHLNTYN